jgi:hypothetical protein
MNGGVLRKIERKNTTYLPTSFSGATIYLPTYLLKMSQTHFLPGRVFFKKIHFVM